MYERMGRHMDTTRNEDEDHKLATNKLLFFRYMCLPIPETSFLINLANQASKPGLCLQ